MLLLSVIVILGALAYPCPGSTSLISKTFSFATPTLPHAFTGLSISEAIAVLPAVAAKNLGVALLLPKVTASIPLAVLICAVPVAQTTP